AMAKRGRCGRTVEVDSRNCCRGGEGVEAGCGGRVSSSKQTAAMDGSNCNALSCDYRTPVDGVLSAAEGSGSRNAFPDFCTGWNDVRVRVEWFGWIRRRQHLAGWTSARVHCARCCR